MVVPLYVLPNNAVFFIFMIPSRYNHDGVYDKFYRVKVEVDMTATTRSDVLALPYTQEQNMYFVSWGMRRVYTLCLKTYMVFCLDGLC